MHRKPFTSFVSVITRRRRRARFVGVLRTAPSRRWCDICQISDAMFEPFVEAVASRLPERAPDVVDHTVVACNASLSAYCTNRTPLDTGLRVLGRPVLKLQETGAYVCEAVADESFLLVYQPNRNEAITS
jgi:hypothetical protein